MRCKYAVEVKGHARYFLCPAFKVFVLESVGSTKDWSRLAELEIIARNVVVDRDVAIRDAAITSGTAKQNLPADPNLLGHRQVYQPNSVRRCRSEQAGARVSPSG